MRSKKTDDFFNLAMNRMFVTVGFKGFDPEFAKQEDWFSLKTWSQEDRENFKSWFIDKAKETLQWSKKTAELEFSYFDLMWGWRIEESNKA